MVVMSSREKLMEKIVLLLSYPGQTMLQLIVDVDNLTYVEYVAHTHTHTYTHTHTRDIKVHYLWKNNEQIS